MEIERPRGPRRIFVFGQRALAAETGEDPERVDALRHAAGQRHIALVQPQHLHALDQPGVAGGTGGSDRVVRADDPQIQGHFAGRVVGHRARVVVVRPETGVVVVPLELEDLVLGLDVAVFGHSQEHAHARRIHVGPVESGIVNRLARAVHAHTARARAAPQVLARLVLGRVEFAHAGQRLADVADLVRPHPAAPCEQARRGTRAEYCHWERSDRSP